MKISKDRLQRMLVLHALEKIPGPIQSDVLADGSLAKRFSIKLGHPISVGAANLPQEVLFDAFKCALVDGKSVALIGPGGDVLSKKVFIDKHTAGVVEIGKQHLRYGFVGLLHPKLAERRKYLSLYLKDFAINARLRAELTDKISSRKRSDVDALKEMIVLGTSLQSHQILITEQLGKQRLNVGELIPDDIRYWENLLAPLQTSRSLSEFFACEAMVELEARLALGPREAFWCASLAFSAPGAVPLAYLEAVSADTVLAMVESAVTLSDHFAIIGAFEICASWITRDDRFVAVGERLLARLFDDKKRLEECCKLFGAAFIVSIARHALSRDWRERPAFWRRITSSAHASLFVRTAAVCDVDANSIYEWAREHFAQGYVASVSKDMRDEPRWRAEWIRPNFLMADVAGRAKQAIALLGDDCPTSWAKRRNEIEAWLDEAALGAMASFPAVGESARPPVPTMDKLGLLADDCNNFIANPTMDKFIGFAGLIFTWGVPIAMMPAINQLLTSLRGRHADIDEKDMQFVLTMASHASVLNSDGELSEKVADLCVERIGKTEDGEIALDYLFRIIECCFADADIERGRATLAQRMETLAFSMSAKLLPNLFVVLRLLQSLDDKLNAPLGRAIAATRLGFGASAA